MNNGSTVGCGVETGSLNTWGVQQYINVTPTQPVESIQM